MITLILRKLTLIAVVLCATSATAEVYSWKDADGKTHFSDTPPVGKEPTLKTITLPPSSTGTPQQPARMAPTTTAPVKSKASSEPSAAQVRQANCEKAKADMQALLDRPRRTAVSKTKKGTSFHTLDGEERTEEEEGLQKLIGENCN